MNLVSEIYSQPRVTRAARLLPKLGLLPGFALDLSLTNKKGENWDFTREDMRKEARELLAREKPMLLVGCPPCTAFSAWQALNKVKYGWTDEEVRRRQAAGEVHLRFCCELYMAQLQGGRFFLHEHPDAASSWSVACIQELLAHPQVGRATGDQCQYGQATRHGHTIKKPTGWMSNAPEVLKELSRRCQGRGGACSSGNLPHATASGRVAREAAVYPFKLCEAILRGMRNQLRIQGRLRPGI